MILYMIYIIPIFLFLILFAILYKFVKECDFESLPIICSVFFLAACFFLFNKDTSLAAVITLGITLFINGAFALNVSRKAQWAIAMLLLCLSVAGWGFFGIGGLLSCGCSSTNESAGLMPSFFALFFVAPVLLLLWLFIMFLLWGSDTDDSKSQSNNEELKG